jgi:hypothetical protein
MSFSTGRGGAGNIHHNTKLTSDLNTTMSTTQSSSIHPTKSGGLSHQTSPNTERKVYYSTGRGGAGNIKTGGEIPSPILAPQGSNTPVLSTPMVTTGRGGYGNMVSNDDPALTRKLQDVDGLHNLQSVASNKSFLVGRGGFGNVISQTKSTNSTGSSGGENNLYAISSHGETLKNTKLKRSFLGKIKEIFNS